MNYKTPDSWDEDYRKLWTDYQKANERLSEYRKELEKRNVVLKAASTLIRHGNLTDPIAQRKYKDYCEALNKLSSSNT